MIDKRIEKKYEKVAIYISFLIINIKISLIFKY